MTAYWNGGCYVGEQTRGGNLYEGATRSENKAQNTTSMCVCCVCVCVYARARAHLRSRSRASEAYTLWKRVFFEWHQMMIKTVFQEISALNPPRVNKTCHCNHSYTFKLHYCNVYLIKIWFETL